MTQSGKKTLGWWCLSGTGLAAVGVGIALYTGSAVAQTPQDTDWRSFAGTVLNQKYAPLDQINKDNVKNLKIAWRQSAVPMESRRGLETVNLPTNYQNTSVKVGNRLFMMTGEMTVAALDAGTGQVLWVDLPPEQAAKPPLPAGTQPKIVNRRAIARTVAYWSDGKEERVLAVNSNNTLIALDARTGTRISTFGTKGAVDLRQGFDPEPPAGTWTSQNAPLIVRDVAIISGTGTRGGRPIPGDIRGYDVRTGRRLWIFHVIPRPGEFGNDTWLKGSWNSSGGAGTWSLLSADEELGYVYIPTETASSPTDYFGGNRPGTNLFEHSVLCLDVKTGKRVWHFQTIRHGLWDWDLPSAPSLVDITVDGKKIKALAQPSKIAYLYVLDRTNGKPVWPMQEKIAPEGDVPGEWYSRTQFHPTKPPAYDRQALVEEDVVDFTPAIKAEALRIVRQYRLGPLFTPPTMFDPSPNGKKGTLMIGTSSTTWPGSGVDPETGIVYTTSVHSPRAFGMVKGPEDGGTPYVLRKTTPDEIGPGDFVEGPLGLPDPFKPPYGRFVAIDLNKGEIKWSVANGDGPRNNPGLKELNLPPLGQGGRVAPLITRTMVFLGEGGNDVPGTPKGSGGKIFRAYDKATGKVIWEMALPGGTTGAPITYMHKGKQYIVVSVSAKDAPGELIALTLP